MTPPPAGTPWWAWFLAVVMVAAIGAGASWLAQHGLRRDVARVGASASHAATELTANHGHSTKDQLTRVESALESVADQQRSQATRTEQLARSVGGLRDDLRTDREIAARRLDNIERRLDGSPDKGVPR